MNFFNISNYIDIEDEDTRFLFSSSIFLGIHDIPQLYHIVKNKQTDDLSIFSYLLKCLFLLFLGGYAFYTDENYMITGTTAGFFQSFMICLLIFHYSFEKNDENNSVLPN